MPALHLVELLNRPQTIVISVHVLPAFLSGVHTRYGDARTLLVRVLSMSVT
jgi:hypothetical protein